MPPKKVSAPAREDTANSDSLPREGRQKRNHNHREVQEEAAVPAPSAVQPFNIEDLDHESLRKYRAVMHLPSSIPTTMPNDRPSEAPNRYTRVEKAEELSAAVKRHWNSTQCKETEVITTFMYAVKNQDKTFKLRFVDSSRN